MDNKKKKYLANKDDGKIKFKKDTEDKNMKDNRGKKTFTSWSKKNMISYQKVGEIENKDMTARGRKGTKTELKRPDQILKVFCYYEQCIICFYNSKREVVRARF